MSQRLEFQCVCGRKQPARKKAHTHCTRDPTEKAVCKAVQFAKQCNKHQHRTSKVQIPPCSRVSQTLTSTTSARISIAHPMDHPHSTASTANIPEHPAAHGMPVRAAVAVAAVPMSPPPVKVFVFSLSFFFLNLIYISLQACANAATRSRLLQIHGVESSSSSEFLYGVTARALTQKGTRALSSTDK